MQPLFRLEMGKPGSSFAFEIARKIGLPEEILAEATDKVGRQHIDFEKHLHDIERDKRYWERKRDDVRRHEKRLDEISTKQLTELEKIEKERKAIIENARKEAQKILADTNRILENTIRTIKESAAEKETTKQARKELETYKEYVETGRFKENVETGRFKENVETGRFK
jgi:DNA mismatch repair protein MutS2